ncbi:putative MFS family arabinose efflux permease [Motilibacter peucedani]|uniref:Putative MFS family arabinose efflux permease n=1 Tax=Motilibacter peucedani TaxID=598650 RepID=A0A420XVD1_9ACTN|nr:MFS transporter [Motilibacter peucedani]RKS80710.1 putative MFS family arabinose efflux permease [Motilibacter peucedani]
MRRLFAGLPAEVAVLSAVAVAVAVGFGVVAPSIPVFARDFGVGEAAAGAVVSAFALTRLAFALAGGRLVDALGERLVLAVGIAIVAVSSALAGLSQSYLQLVLLRGVGGVGSAMFTVSAMALLLRVTPRELRGRATGVYQGGFILGGVTGPAFGGPLTQWSIRAPFFVYAATLAVAGAIAMAFLAHSRVDEQEAGDAEAPQRTSLAEALRSRGYVTALCASLGSGWVAFGIRSSLIPLFVVEALHAGAGWTGAGFAVSSAAQALLLLPAGRLTDSGGRRFTLSTGLAVATASSVVLVVCGSTWVFLVAMALMGAGFALISPASGAVVGDIVRGRGGTVVAAFQMASDVGAISGPVIAGWLAQEVSYPAAFAAGAVVLALCTALAVTMPETRAAGSAARPAAPADR